MVYKNSEAALFGRLRRIMSGGSGPRIDYNGFWSAEVI